MTRVEEVFELELCGGAVERRYRSARSDVEAMPWGTLRTAHLHPDTLAETQMMWSVAAFQEHRTGAHCAQALRALFECRAPLDLVGVFSRFPLDEVAHVEMAARMASELGNVTEVRYAEEDVIREPPATASPLMRASELVVRVFCVGESLSIPLLHLAWRDADQPLSRAVLGRIVRDEAAHGTVGWTFLDWAEPLLDDDDRVRLATVANDAIGEILKLWARLKARPSGPRSWRNGMGWVGDERYLRAAEVALAKRVVAPLLRRDIVVDLSVLPAGVHAALAG
jgi:hypothetical protein